MSCRRRLMAGGDLLGQLKIGEDLWGLSCTAFSGGDQQRVKMRVASGIHTWRSYLSSRTLVLMLQTAKPGSADQYGSVAKMSAPLRLLRRRSRGLLGQ